MINVIGLGYIGLPTALMLAKSGLNIVGTDINKSLIRSLKKGELNFEEKGLERLFNIAIKNKIKFSEEYQKTDVYIIAVPTPYLSDSKKIDAKYVISAIESILEVCLFNSIIIIESTISPGTINKYIKPKIQESGFSIGNDIHLVHAPERIIPGNMIYELEYNSRTIGADSIDIAEKVKAIYSTFCKGEIVMTDIKSAEMSKVVENTYRDINIAFANELAIICRQDKLNVYEIIRIANKHPRVNILNPGPGVGGHCISVDPWFLVGDYPDLTKLILTARKINDSMPDFVISRIKYIMGQNNIDSLSQVGLYGLTYKENVDDTRESPTLQLLKILENHFSCDINVYDPYIKENIINNQYHDFEKFIRNIRILVVMVGHNHLLENVNLIKNKIILDTRNVIKEFSTYKL
ncbi:nucleotide sugar dehydrogenase [Candidatus Izemoplasma sp. B36]|uniref:nucleotide sugar dehydrogenase n=1 Tax=Candidatus Izemoplasma sp. B36 TaxID=3242468 RepID=UPI003556864F